MVEKGWDINTVMNLPNHTRKAIVGISFKQNGIKDFDIEEFIDRRSYFTDEESLNNYIEKERIRKLRKDKELEKRNSKKISKPKKIRLKSEVEIIGEDLSVQERIELFKKKLQEMPLQVMPSLPSK